MSTHKVLVNIVSVLVGNMDMDEQGIIFIETYGQNGGDVNARDGDYISTGPPCSKALDIQVLSIDSDLEPAYTLINLYLYIDIVEI
jgi:hypothetical protein